MGQEELGIVLPAKVCNTAKIATPKEAAGAAPAVSYGIAGRYAAISFRTLLNSSGLWSASASKTPVSCTMPAR